MLAPASTIRFGISTITNENNITVNILKSIDGQYFKTIKTISLSAQQNLSSYHFQDEYNSIAVYKIEIVKNNNIQRYLSKAYNFSNQSENVDVFPTITNDKINVNFQTINAIIEYQITNSLGQTQQKGTFASNFNSIDVSTLKTGIYYVVINIDNQRYTTKINKQ